MSLEFKNVCKKNLLKNTNLILKDGDSLEIVSADTSHTSDILKLIIGFKKPNSGKILLFNHDQAQSLTKAKASIGYTAGLKVKGNKTVIKYLTQTESFYKADFSENIDKYLSLFNIDKNKMIADLTNYEKINLSIINAIFFNPELIILNNITDKMDDTSLAILNNILFDLRKSNTSVISASIKNDLLDSDIYLYNDNNLAQANDISSYNKIYLRADKFDASELSNISNLKITDNGIISFICKGNINLVLKKLVGNSNIIRITKPLIEEICYEQAPDK